VQDSPVTQDALAITKGRPRNPFVINVSGMHVDAAISAIIILYPSATVELYYRDKVQSVTEISRFFSPQVIELVVHEDIVCSMLEDTSFFNYGPGNATTDINKLLCPQSRSWV
jgi:hypothetical protein